MPRASILMTVYNGDRHISSSIQSALDQTIQDIELLIFNDGSSDGTRSIIEAVVDSRVTVVHSERVGRARALNEGVKACSSAYVAILDADDIALPTRVEEQIAFLDRRKKVDLVGSRYRCVIDEQGAPVRDVVLPMAYPGFVRWFHNERCPLFHSSVMFRRAAVMGIGGYDETLTHCLDLDLYVRLLAAAPEPNIANMDSRLSLKRVHSKQYFGPENGVRTSQEGVATREEVRRRVQLAFGHLRESEIATAPP